MKKKYLGPSLTYVEFTADVITTSGATEKPYGFGDGDWGVEDDFI